MAWDDDEDMDLARSLKICPILVDACGIKKGEELAWPSVFPESRGRGSGFVAAAAAVVAAATAAPFTSTRLRYPPSRLQCSPSRSPPRQTQIQPSSGELAAGFTAAPRQAMDLLLRTVGGSGLHVPARCLAGVQLFLDLE